MTAAQRMQALLAAPGMAVAPLICDPISAMVAEREGYPLVVISGAGSEAAVLGQPDVGYISLKEIADHAGNIANAVEIPALCDCDTGYGSPISIRRTVHEFEMRGVAGIILEDTTDQKRNSTVGWTELEPIGPAADRIKIAVDARKDDNFLIVARTDALTAGKQTPASLEDALRRAEAYLAAGAGMIWYTGTGTRELLADCVAGTAGPVLGSLRRPAPGEPDLTLADMEGWGYKVTLSGGAVASSLNVYIKAYAKVLRTLRETGSVQAILDLDLTATHAEFVEFTRLSETIRKYMGATPVG
jgi:2-methylisocitrate lyase-like PEP mutase family enzyme